MLFVAKGINETYVLSTKKFGNTFKRTMNYANIKNCSVSYLSEEHVESIIKSCFEHEDVVMENFTIWKASENMLGFLADYWKLQIQLIVNKKDRRTLRYFIKSISTTNMAKAKMVKEMGLFDKELYFYSVIKNHLHFPDIRPWSASLAAVIKDAMVFEDLNSLQYKTRNKLQRFDRDHTLQALNTLARYHASSIIFEERQSRLLNRKYCINDEFINYLNRAGYQISDQWFLQCMTGALEAIKMFSKYGKDVKLLNRIEDRWKDVWQSALKLCDTSPERCGVICHRDLWNNNLMFRYKKVSEDKFVPDDCLIVDFQAARYQEPAGDVMLLLYCNLDPIDREDNMQLFLNHYYEELKVNLLKYEIKVDAVLSFEHFLLSSKEQRLWGLIVSACLTPQFWLNDTLTTEIFCDTQQFNQILSEDKGAFIKKMMRENQEYKNIVLGIFEEIVERYCLK